MQYTNFVWSDGQPYSERFDDIYYSSAAGDEDAGIGEFDHVFFKHNDLKQRWKDRDNFVIAELGLGSTLNCLLTIREWLKHCDDIEIVGKPKKILHYIAIERYPLSPEAITGLLSNSSELAPYSEELLESYPPAVETTHVRWLFDNRVVIHYKFMDVMDALASTNLDVDAWYLDGFSPAKNPDMWSKELFEQIAANSHAAASCSTYTSAGFVKRNLQAAGFIVEKVAGYGKKRDMLVATLPPQKNLSSAKHAYKYNDKPWFKSSQNKKTSSSNATIIGAGIAGLSTASALVKRGWKVTIIDKHAGVASEASANLAAIVYPRLSVNNDTDTEFYIASYCYALHFLNDLQKSCPARKFWYDHGLLQKIEERRLDEIVKKFQFNKNFIDRFEGGLSPLKDDDQTFIHYKNSGVVMPKKLCQQIFDSCSDGIQLLEEEVGRVDRKDGKWQCYAGSQLLDESEVLIIANGSGINISGMESEFPIEKVRGQMLALNAEDRSCEIKETINEEIYITPLIDGAHYLGATYSRNDVNLESLEEDTISLLDSVDRVYPEIFGRHSCKKTWVGIRMMAKDRCGIVGQAPDIDFFREQYADICDGNIKKQYKPARYLSGLYYSLAHGSRGFTQSFLCAEIIASLINAEPAPVSERVLKYLSPSRFVVNDLKRR